ncbi:MAG: hypothetical protein MUP85_04545 [Candidatus Lokiarchaeota archaeon]|nr:hypothetical protein [Candidatus Lokiarchaeota archaeon]
MTDYIKDPYLESEYDEIFNDWYEIDGVRKIKELSRQLQTFFNYKTELIRYRFQSSPNPTQYYSNTNFFSRKKEIESLTHDFITLLKTLKKDGQILEQGVHSLFLKNNKSQINKLSIIIEKLSILLHYFSEESLHNRPKLLKFNVSLAQTLCLVKKCLYAQFCEFYGELEINYHSLNGELEILIEKTSSMKIRKPKKLLEGGLTS